ncbi:eukaryotic translation initiation factor 2-alpha kinase [Exophiala viscosa]|uniref:eukaryotic translation initiation factor 2-alpha kinase n=1 Tax=Exophiala viscosa TaxID=2486360 RepID=UPI00219EDE8A|nr:eukaryotic translation initiation factor 2-alpha kinase [Exophiala viscosa]
MSSTFFRRPGDDSSSSSSGSEPDVSNDIEHSDGQHVDSITEETETATTESLSSHGSISVGDTVDPTLNVANVELHRANLLNALLEDFAKNRACEILNAAKPGADLNRSSPEVQHLAGRLYDQVSQSLAQTGVLPTTTSHDIHGDKQLRATYINGLESIAVSGLQNNHIPGTRPSLSTPEQHLAVARMNNEENDPISHLLQQPLAHLSLRDNHMPNPYSDLILSSAPTNPRSHYESSFQQLSLLGKGGFGKVYHTFNIFDKKEYAVKKIPLSPRLSQRYKESGHKELEHVLREVQALAQLEHNNVVRYHATWIEEPKRPRDSVYHSAEPNLTAPGRRLIADGRAPIPKPRPSHILPAIRDYSDGIIFGLDSVSHDPLHHAQHDADSVCSARPSEIFTDGHAQPNAQYDVVMDDSVYVLHVQMSVYPMTLAQYLAPPPANARSAPSQPLRRHCFHLIPTLRILMGILCGLQYIHAMGLVHRDIKPSNIFISSLSLSAGGEASEGYYDVGDCVACPNSDPYHVNPRIGDFGLVAELARDGGIDSDTVGTITGKAVGTEFYRPPQWTDTKGKRRSSSIDEKLDVFALGVVLVEMLWYCTTKSERLIVLGDLQRGKVPAGLVEKIDNEGHVPRAGNSVCQCISGMIDPDPQQRWSCAEVKEWIEKILENCTVENTDSGQVMSLGEVEEQSEPAT